MAYSPLITFRQGDDVAFSVAVVDDSGDPFSLSTVLGLFANFVGTYGKSDTTLALSLGSGITVSSPASAGIFSVAMTKAQTATFLPLLYNMEIRIELASGSIETLLEGVAEVSGQIKAVP